MSSKTKVKVLPGSQASIDLTARGHFFGLSAFQAKRDLGVDLSGRRIGMVNVQEAGSQAPFYPPGTKFTQKDNEWVEKDPIKKGTPTPEKLDKFMFVDTDGNYWVFRNSHTAQIDWASDANKEIPKANKWRSQILGRVLKWEFRETRKAWSMYEVSAVQSFLPFMEGKAWGELTKDERNQIAELLPDRGLPGIADRYRKILKKYLEEEEDDDGLPRAAAPATALATTPKSKTTVAAKNSTSTTTANATPKPTSTTASKSKQTSSCAKKSQHDIGEEDSGSDESYNPPILTHMAARKQRLPLKGSPVFKGRE